jgi:uncharacterized protein (UPF0335 family)
VAKKITQESAASKARGGVKAAELRKLVTDINRHKKMASESSGLAGKATQMAAEAHGLDKGALTQCCRLDKWEPAKRQAFLRSFLDYGEKLGFFNEIDAFDDTVAILEEIVARARANEGEVKAPVGEVKSLLDGDDHKGVLQ